jgi:uncharacterized protein YqjF (DUF2071 family)
MFMRWHDLLFAHWRVDAARLREFVPPGLEIETFDGAAWLGVVPFRMSAIRHRWLPPIPGLSAFPELNVRTYVRPAGDSSRPGVWFFSLDAASRVAVRVARATFGLAYMDARMTCRGDGEAVVYESRRTGPWASLAFGGARTKEAEFVGGYAPVGQAFVAAPGSLESLLTDRFCLYAWRRGGLWRGEIDHPPWPLQRAQAKIERNTMAAAIGLSADDLRGEPLLHFARRLDVVAWRPEPVAHS